MPSKTKKLAEPDLPEIPNEQLEQLVTGPMTAEAIESITRRFKKAMIEKALGAEMSYHLVGILVNVTADSGHRDRCA